MAFSAWLKPAVTGRVGSSSWQMSVRRFATFQPSGVRLLEDLVPDAPHHDARVVPVAPDHVAQVALAPLGEVLAVAVLDLRLAPHVEGLVQDEEAHPVGGVEQLGRGRVVARADGVRAHALQDLELALDRAPVDGGAERAEVVVVADALKRDAAAVQRGSPCPGPHSIDADAERRLVPVEHGVAALHGADRLVEVGTLDVPAPGPDHRDPDERGRGGAGGNGRARTGSARPRDPRDRGSPSRARRGRDRVSRLRSSVRTATVAPASLTAGVVT